MKIYRPIKTDRKTQAFGENIPCVRQNEDGSVIQPFQVITPMVPYTCPIGYTKFYPSIGLKGHNGEDWQSFHGEPVYFPVLDTVEWLAATEVDSSGGIGVRVRSKTPVSIDQLPSQAIGSLNMIQKQYMDLGGKLYLIFLFWHLKSVNVYDKQPIKFGDLLGYADSTGASSGDHVHFAMKVSDPTSWFTIDGDNGYSGAIDFSRWFENKYVLDTVPTKPPFKYNWPTSMVYGQRNADISNLQKALQLEGAFPSDVPPTGYYGDITAQAVLNFRVKYNISSTSDPLGRSCGPLTRAKLNLIYN